MSLLSGLKTVKSWSARTTFTLIILDHHHCSPFLILKLMIQESTNAKLPMKMVMQRQSQKWSSMVSGFILKYNVSLVSLQFFLTIFVLKLSKSKIYLILVFYQTIYFLKNELYFVFICFYFNLSFCLSW